VTTSVPVSPKAFSIIGAVKKLKNTKMMTASITKLSVIVPAIPGCVDESKIIVVIAPGPAIKGMARGNTDGSFSAGSASLCAARRLRRPVNNISSAVRNNSIPPEIRNAGSEMPRKVNADSPNRQKINRMTAPITVARKAIARRAAVVSPLNKLTKTGVNPDRINDDEECYERSDKKRGAKNKQNFISF
jgi:hypothetical protein